MGLDHQRMRSSSWMRELRDGVGGKRQGSTTSRSRQGLDVSSEGSRQDELNLARDRHLHGSLLIYPPFLFFSSLTASRSLPCKDVLPGTIVRPNCTLLFSLPSLHSSLFIHPFFCACVFFSSGWAPSCVMTARAMRTARGSRRISCRTSSLRTRMSSPLRRPD